MYEGGSAARHGWPQSPFLPFPTTCPPEQFASSNDDDDDSDETLWRSGTNTTTFAFGCAADDRTVFASIRDVVLEHGKLWSWFLPEPKNLCHIDTFAACMLFTFAEAELRQFIVPSVHTVPALKSLLRCIVSACDIESANKVRYEWSRQAFGDTFFGDHEDVQEHFRRLLHSDQTPSSPAARTALAGLCSISLQQQAQSVEGMERHTCDATSRTVRLDALTVSTSWCVCL